MEEPDQGSGAAEVVPSPLGFALRILGGVVPGLVLGAMVLGKLAGWHWFRTYRLIDTATFCVGALLFMSGAFTGIPRFSAPIPEAPPEEEYPNLSEDELVGMRMARDERQALQRIKERSRRRAPGLMLAGCLVLLSSMGLFQARFFLGSLYGYREASPTTARP